ncbi:hypothetical protein P7C73_g2861, partial [Tremellales sp. Uapishka_1]
MSVAVIQGSSSGLGLALAQHVLRNTRLKVYALTHQSSDKDVAEKITSGLDRDSADRLTVLSNVNVAEERGLEDAASTVKEREGRGSVRLLTCLAGVVSLCSAHELYSTLLTRRGSQLHAEKSLSAVSPDTALDSFAINTLGHLLTYKHFVPLIPSKRDLEKQRWSWADHKTLKDPAMGLICDHNSLCFSLSARVGSIQDNHRGGWYTYRASKAALNQIVRSLDHELKNRASSALAVAYHPGTVLTSFTAPIIGSDAEAKPEKGVFTIEEAIKHMTDTMKRARRDEDWGGCFRDWKGERVEW